MRFNLDPHHIQSSIHSTYHLLFLDEESQTSFRHLLPCTKLLHIVVDRPEVIVLGYYNVHNENWLDKIEPQGRAAKSFVVNSDMTKIFHKPALLRRVSGVNSNSLDMFLTTHPR